MLVLTIRSDKPEAEIGLYESSEQMAYQTWQAHRELSQTIHNKIKELLDQHDKSWGDIQGIVGFEGPGSFTGLRIGLTVGNTLASSLNIPVVGSAGEDWIAQGLEKLQKGQNETVVMPEYGADPHITKPHK